VIALTLELIYKLSALPACRRPAEGRQAGLTVVDKVYLTQKNCRRKEYGKI